jgi:UDP-2-acetamido-3-amino-2,3-dideoxy-glucuronate N-acetyltransferase
MLPALMAARIHPTSVVADSTAVGDGTQIWLHCQIRENVKIGKACIFGKGVYVDPGVTIGNAVKIQNNASLYTGVTIEDGVFVGPHVCFTNDKVPRAVNPDMSLKTADDWAVTPTRVMAGAALGANSTIVCGTTIGRWAMVAAGSVVTKDVPDHALVMGNPARVVGWVCSCGQRVAMEGDGGSCACGRALARGKDGVVRVV